MFKLTLYNNDNGHVAWVENYDTLSEFVEALEYYGAKYNGKNDVMLIL